MTGIPWLTLLWVGPLVGAAAVMALPSGQRAITKWLALSITIAVLITTLVVALRFKPDGDHYQLVESYPWIPAFGSGYVVGVD